MHHVRELHVTAQVVEPGQQLVEHEAGRDDDHAERQRADPEQHLLAGIEARRRHFRAAEQAAEAPQPGPVGALEQLIADEDDDHHQQRHREQRPGEVVDVLQRIGEPAEQRVADQRQQQRLAEGHHEAGHREQHEGDRIGPVRGALEGREALDLAAGVGLMAADRPLAPIEQRQRKQHDEQQRTAVRNDPAVAHLAPSLAGVGDA